MREIRNAYKILVGKPEWKRRPGVLGIEGWSIVMVIKEIRWEDVDWMYLAQDRDSDGLLWTW
jgi:hypothetical protein